MAHVDYFLKIEGIPGESTDDKHKGEIDILSFSFGAANPSSGSSGGGAGAGKVSFQDMHFTMQTNVSSPQLFSALAQGKHLNKAVLSCRKAGGKVQDFLKITLQDCLVSSYATGANLTDGGYSPLAGDDVPLEQFSLNFSKIALDLTSPSGDEVTSGDLGGNEVG